MRTVVSVLVGVALAVCCSPPAEGPSNPATPSPVPAAQPAAGADSGDSGPADTVTLSGRDRPLREVVQTIARSAGVNIVIADEIDETVTLEFEEVEWRKALDVAAEEAHCVVVELGANLLRVEQPPPVYSHFGGEDVHKVIDRIARVSGANIVVAADVQGTISLRLEGIPWRDALDAVAKTLGYVVVEEANGVLRVTPPNDVADPLVTQGFQLRYFRPKAGELGLLDSLRSALTPEVGTLEYFAGNNVVVVKDTRPVVDEVGRIIEQIDRQPARVLVDVTLVTAGQISDPQVAVDATAARKLVGVAQSAILRGTKVIVLDHQAASLFAGEARSSIEVRVTAHVVPGTDKVVLEVAPLPHVDAASRILLRSGQTAVLPCSAGEGGMVALVTARVLSEDEGPSSNMRRVLEARRRQLRGDRDGIAGPDAGSARDRD